MNIKKSVAILLTSAILLVQNPCPAVASSSVSVSSGLSSQTTPEKYFESDYDKTNRGYYITKYTGTANNIVIPTTIDGQPVTGIDKKVFKDKAIESIVIPDSVLWIGASAFENCSSLIDISIAESVNSIGSKAFAGCTSLKSITIPSKIKKVLSSTFEDCVLLENVDLPSGLKSIEDYAFRNCKSLKEINIPNKVTTISIGAFSNCSSITSINIPPSIKYIGDSSSSSEALVFWGCDSLEAININGLNYEYYTDDGVLYKIEYYNGNAITGSRLVLYPSAKKDKEYTLPQIANYPMDSIALANCKYLEAINVESGNTRYSSKDGVLFTSNMSNLVSYPKGKKSKDYVIPLGVSVLSPYAFTNLQYLTSLTISAGVEKLYTDSNFTGSLKTINVDKRNERYSSTNGVLYNKSQTELILYPDAKKDKKYIIPNGVESICDNAFANCEKLVNIVIPDSVKSIGRDSFYNCSTLKSVSIPKNAKVEANAFSYCTSLKSVTVNGDLFGESIFGYCTSLTRVNIKSRTSIPNCAFIGCTALQNISIGDNVKRIGEEAFIDCTNLTTVSIKSGLTTVRKNAFKNCPLVKVKYCGKTYTAKNVRKIYSSYNW